MAGPCWLTRSGDVAAAVERERELVRGLLRHLEANADHLAAGDRTLPAAMVRASAAYCLLVLEVAWLQEGGTLGLHVETVPLTDAQRAALTTTAPEIPR